MYDTLSLMPGQLAGHYLFCFCYVSTRAVGAQLQNFYDLVYLILPFIVNLFARSDPSKDFRNEKSLNLIVI